ncbi:hypothetical protein KK083_20285 [Fulvivirgaceae bacterium PWU4]|uniref:Uncharacterized protein n=1 Tax=Chryseosolibacter histidini TaxID=2782349 RepID=A0AAP2GR62_9BACT|nr:hypothetical protein [Chryseosolibacter histidini]MBT1699247.1 hypothetical protein [Chryseosolibacter histidini]
MTFRLAVLFPEVGVDFPISYKVNQLLLDKLIDKLPKEQQQVIVDNKSFSLGVIISTRKSKTDLSIQGPSISKKYKMVDYTIWIPYLKVIKSSSLLETYLDFISEGIILVFEDLGRDNKKLISKIVGAVKKQVLTNPSYQYNPEDDEW